MAPNEPTHAGPLSGCATWNTSVVASGYAWQRPAPQRVTFRLLWKKVGYGLRILRALACHAVGFFEPMPRPGTALTPSQPGGAISEEMLAVCRSLASASENRLSKLETKATGLLSLIAVVIPLTASAAVFVRQHDIPAIVADVTLTLNLIAVFAFLLALLAALRAVAIRGHEALFLNAVIDPKSDRVRNYSADFYGRGLLQEAAVRQAICDHIADFVRAAQLFLALGVLFAASAAIPVLAHIRPESPATLNGTISIGKDSLLAISEAAAKATAPLDTQIRRLESQIQALRDAQADAKTRRDIERLSKDVAQLRRSLQAQTASKHH